MLSLTLTYTTTASAAALSATIAAALNSRCLRSATAALNLDSPRGRRCFHRYLRALFFWRFFDLWSLWLPLALLLVLSLSLSLAFLVLALRSFASLVLPLVLALASAAASWLVLVLVLALVLFFGRGFLWRWAILRTFWVGNVWRHVLRLADRRTFAARRRC